MLKKIYKYLYNKFIGKSGYYIEGGLRTELYSKDIILRRKFISELVLPENCIFCSCEYNEITKLIINQNCKTIICSFNNLAELVLPENCTYCSCAYNNLTKLIINSNCEKFFCSFNQLTELILPENCTYCQCSSNNLTNLVINDKCKELYCTSNKLIELIVPRNCSVHCFNNKFSPYIADLIYDDRKLSNRIFMMEDCKLKSMLLSNDEETFNLAI